LVANISCDLIINKISTIIVTCHENSWGRKFSLFSQIFVQPWKLFKCANLQFTIVTDYLSLANQWLLFVFLATSQGMWLWGTHWEELSRPSNGAFEIVRNVNLWLLVSRDWGKRWTLILDGATSSTVKWATYTALP